MVRKILYTIAFSLTYLFVGITLIFDIFLIAPLLFKLIMLGCIAGIVYFFAHHMMALYIFVLLIAILCIRKALKDIKDGYVDPKDDEWYWEQSQRVDTTYSGSTYSGMTIDMARKKYRSLMKQYHPDNPGGSEEKSKEITAEFEQFKKATMNQI